VFRINKPHYFFFSQWKTSLIKQGVVCLLLAKAPTSCWVSASETFEKKKNKNKKSSASKTCGKCLQFPKLFNAKVQKCQKGKATGCK
jgi:hypothetical protein